VNLHGVVLILESEGNEGVASLYAIYEIGATLDHSLVDELFKRLLLAYISSVIKEFVPESGVDEVTCGVFRTPDIEVHIAPVFIGLAAHQFLGI